MLLPLLQGHTELLRRAPSVVKNDDRDARGCGIEHLTFYAGVDQLVAAVCEDKSAGSQVFHHRSHALKQLLVLHEDDVREAIGEEAVIELEAGFLEHVGVSAVKSNHLAGGSAGRVRRVEAEGARVNGG